MHAIGEASRRSGVHIETIRYYEREGIVPPAQRGPNGRRHYTDGDIARIRFVKRCRDLGFSMRDSRKLLDLSGSNGMTCGQARPIAREHLDQVDAKIDQLTHLRTALSGLVAQCDSEPPECPLLSGLLED